MKEATGSAVDIRYGWLVVAAGLLSIAVHSMIGYSGSLFLVAIIDDTTWSRAVVSGYLSLYALGSSLWLPLVGFLIQAWGPRRVLPAAALTAAGALLILSSARSSLVFSLAMLVPLALGSVGVGSLANYTAIQPWFQKKQSTALALAATGSSVGVLIMPLIQHLILTFGWRGAYQVMAGAALALAPLHILVQRQVSWVEPPKPEVGDPNIHDLRIIGILGDREFWLLFMGLATSSFSMNLIMVHHIAYLTDVGFGSTSIASALGIIGFAGLIGRIGFGWLSDRIGTTPVFAVVTGCMLTAILSLTWSGKNGSVPFLYIFGTLFGASLNVAIILFARPTIDCFGGRNFGRVSGLAYVGAGIGVASGPAFAGVSFDITGNYLSSFGVAAVAFVLSFVCLQMLGRAVKRRVAS